MLKPKMTIEKKFDDSALLDKAIKEIQRYSAKVGFLTSAGTHPDSNLPVATIAVYNEFGTPNARHPIPARPFLRPVFADTNDQKKIIATLIPKTFFVKSGKRLAKNPRAKLFFKLYSMIMAARIQKKIRSNIAPENAEWTKAQKGETKNRTLIDTEAMLQAVNYEVIG